MLVNYTREDIWPVMFSVLVLGSWEADYDDIDNRTLNYDGIDNRLSGGDGRSLLSS